MLLKHRSSSICKDQQEAGQKVNRAYGPRWRIVPAAAFVSCTVPRQLVPGICRGKLRPGGRKSPHAEQDLHTSKALQPSFPLLSKLADLPRKTENLENKCRDFKLFICFMLFCCSTSKKASNITQYDCTGSHHAHIENIYFILSSLH